MKSSMIVLAAWAFAAGAHAHGDTKCDSHPQGEWKPQMELQKSLADKGWKVRQVKTWNNCYEVYGFDDKGARTEAFFDPKTFERVDAAMETPQK